MHTQRLDDNGVRSSYAFTRRELNGALLASALALAAGVPFARVSPARVRLFDFAIAGGYYHGLYRALPGLVAGTSLALVREPENPFDSNAVAVHLAADGLKLGFVPRAANPPLARLLDRGVPVRAEIVGMLDVKAAKAIPDNLVFTSFSSGDPMIRLTVERTGL